MIEIREETAGDHAAIRQINEVAFAQQPEAAVVDRLRAGSGQYVSFVAVDGGTLVGYVVFTRATIDGSKLVGMGLGPMAVIPSRQKQGIGSMLVRHCLNHLQQSGCPFVVVRGRPEYFQRFGFEPASHYKLTSQWKGAPDESFMVIAFDSDSLPEVGGTARYRAEFDVAT